MPRQHGEVLADLFWLALRVAYASWSKSVLDQGCQTHHCLGPPGNLPANMFDLAEGDRGPVRMNDRARRVG